MPHTIWRSAFEYLKNFGTHLYKPRCGRILCAFGLSLASALALLIFKKKKKKKKSNFKDLIFSARIGTMPYIQCS